MPEDGSGAPKGFDRHVPVVWIKQTIDLRPARMHHRCPAALAEFSLLRSCELPCDHFLDRTRLEFLERAFLFEEVVDG